MQEEEILINCCYGGFSVSEKFIDEYFKRTGKIIERYGLMDRKDVDAIQIVKELGKKANGKHADIKIEKNS